jgi:hypothetical protein
LGVYAFTQMRGTSRHSAVPNSFQKRVATWHNISATRYGRQVTCDGASMRYPSQDTETV